MIAGITLGSSSYTIIARPIRYQNIYQQYLLNPHIVIDSFHQNVAFCIPACLQTIIARLRVPGMLYIQISQGPHFWREVAIIPLVATVIIPTKVRKRGYQA